MMASSLKSVSGESIDVRSDLRALTSVWAALRANYEGTNITKTIARLLNMYRPEDGVGAYERLLRTLIVLLEDFDNNDLRSLISMIPPPKECSEKTIKEIFLNSTGFTRIYGPTFYQNFPYFLYEKNLIKSEEEQKELNKGAKHSGVEGNDFINLETVSNSQVTNQDMKSPHKLFHDCHSFQGLSTTETVYSHNKNTQHSPYLNCDQYLSHQYFMKRQADSLYLPPMSCQKNWGLNQTPLLIKNCNTVQSNFPCRSMLVKTVDNKYLRLPVTPYNVSNIHYLNHPYQNQKSSLKEKNVTNLYDSSNNISQTQVSGALNDIEYKKELLKKRELLNESVRSDLEECDYNFLEKEKGEDNDDGKKTNQFLVSFEDCILETLIVNKNLKNCIENFLNRLKQDVSLNIKKTPIPNMDVSVQKQKPSSSTCPKIIDSPLSQRKNNLQSDLRNTNNNSTYQTNSISELTAHKRQYYDALLNVQRAKMAVANSLTLSPAQSCGDYDPYYMDYLQQYHWPVQQPQDKTIHGISDCQKFLYPQYSHFYDSHIRSTNWNSSCPSPRIPQEMPFLHTSSMYGSRFIYNFSNDTSQYPDSSKTKSAAKKRKLDNTVVKLKESDINSMHY